MYFNNFPNYINKSVQSACVRLCNNFASYAVEEVLEISKLSHVRTSSLISIYCKTLLLNMITSCCGHVRMTYKIVKTKLIFFKNKNTLTFSRDKGLNLSRAHIVNV